MSMLIIIILFLSIVFWKAKYITDKQKYCDTPLSYSNTRPIRGICAVEIMLGHIGVELTNEVVLFPFRKAGILIVGIFFFLSGYGLMCSLINKENYLNTFLKKRCVSIFLPVIVVLFLFIGCFWIENSFVLRDYNLSEIFVYALKSINWYVWEILAFYFLFYIVFSNITQINALYLISGFSLIFVIVCYIAGVTNPWYGSTLCFPLGLWVGKYEKQFFTWCRQKMVEKAVCLITILGISIIAFFLLPERSIVGAIISRNIASIVFTLIVIIILQKVKIGNEITNHWGNISFEIFLVHPIAINLYHSDFVYVDNNIFYVIVVFISSILLAIGVKRCVNILQMISQRIS